MPVRPAPRDHGLSSDGAHIVSWISNVPTCTRFLIVGAIVFSIASGLKIVHAHYFAFYWTHIWTKFQIWRILTSVLTYQLSFHGLLCVIMLYQYSNELERHEYAGRTADYAWFLIFCCGVMFVGHWWLSWTFFFSEGLLMGVTTLWAIHRPNTIVKFMFAFQFPAKYLPYVLMGIEYLFIRVSFPFDMAYGWGATHLYYYLAVDLPSRGGINYIPTPQFVYKMLGQVHRASNRYGSSGVATSSNPIHQMPGGGHFWGSGRRLG